MGSATPGTNQGTDNLTLTESQMPVHTHTGPAHTHTGPSHTHTGPAHTHTVPLGQGGTNTPAYADGAIAKEAPNPNTGSSGTGDTGASGTGATGSLASLQTHIVFTTGTLTGGDQTLSVTCDGTDLVTGGGFDDEDSSMDVFSSTPITSGAEGWEIVVESTGGSTGPFSVYAVCLDITP